MKIVRYQSKESDEITEEELFEKTLELAKIVKSIIIYLLSSVEIEEAKKENNGMYLTRVNGRVKDNEKY